jgi:hypothetical protein
VSCAVTSRVRYAAPVFPNEPVKDCAPFSQALGRADLIRAHEAAVALNIAAKTATRRRLTVIGSDMRAPMPRMVASVGWVASAVNLKGFAENTSPLRHPRLA